MKTARHGGVLSKPGSGNSQIANNITHCRVVGQITAGMTAGHTICTCAWPAAGMQGEPSQQQLQQPLVPAWAGHDRRPVLARALHCTQRYSIMRLAPQGWQDACKLKAAQRHLNLTTDSTLAHRDPVSSRHCAEINGRATSWTNNRTGLTGYNACRAHSLVESRRACLCSNRDRQNRSGARMHAHRSAGAAPPAWRRAPRRRRSPAAAAAAGPAPAVP